MLSRTLIPLIRQCRQAPRSVYVASRGYSDYSNPHGDGPYVKPSYDELLSPEGDWKEHYDKTNKKYNMILLGSIVVLLSVITFGRKSGLLYFNPELPSFEEVYEEDL